MFNGILNNNNQILGSQISSFADLMFQNGPAKHSFYDVFRF